MNGEERIGEEMVGLESKGEVRTAVERRVYSPL